MKTKQQFTIKNSLPGVRAYRNFAVGLFTFLAAYLVASLLAPVHNSSAETQLLAANVTNTDAGVSITPGRETVELNVGQPDPNGSFIAASDTLTAKSTATHGYQLYVSMANNHTDGNRLYLDGDETSGFIAPNHDEEGNTITYPSTATVARNAWGFTTSSEDNDNEVFGALPLMGNEYQIASKETPTSLDGEPIQVYYAVNVDTNMVSGTYTGNVLYTIIAEIDNADLGTPSISPQSASYNDTVNISVPLKSIVSSTEDLGTVTAKLGDQACNITNMTLGSATINIACTVPRLKLANRYNVEVHIQKYDSTFVADNAFLYLQDIADITYMQEMTTEICNRSAAKQKAQLLDARGYGDAGSDKTTKYSIVKALGEAGDENSECWMTDNLNLYNITISAEDSDFNSSETYTIPAAVTATSQWSSSNSSDPKVEVSHGLGTSATKDTTYYGYAYYNWASAVAIESSTGVADTPNTSICPKNWTLPNGGGDGMAKTYAHLLANVASTKITTGANLLKNTDLRFVKYYGSWTPVTPSERYQGQYGSFWAGTADGSVRSYVFSYNSSAVEYTTGVRGYGHSLRCVAR